MVEHFGRKCRGAHEDPRHGRGRRLRLSLPLQDAAPQCGEENDIAARECCGCQALLVDNDKKLREAMALKDAHVMRPDSMVFDKTLRQEGQRAAGDSLLRLRRRISCESFTT